MSEKQRSLPGGRLRRRLAALTTGAVALTVLGVPVATPAAAENLPQGFSLDVTPTGYGSPVEAAWAPDGRTFVAEKAGRVKTVLPDGTVRELLDLRNRVNSYSDRGLLGIATDKEFATNGYLYLLYSQELEPANPDGTGAMTSVLSRVTVRPDSTVVNPSAPETIILGKDGATPCLTPDNDRDCIPADHYWHSIGTVRVDPVDGTLWVGNGDAHRHRVETTSYRPYDEASMAGKILHIDRNGRGLAGHPFCAGESDLSKVCTKIYAKGFRNPYRFHLRPGRGPVVGDVGFAQHEEINLIAPGRNYGWPCYEGTERTRLYAETSKCAELYAQEGTAQAATPPSWSYPHLDGAAVVAGPVYNGTSYPAEMRGDIFVGDYVQGWVKRLDVDASDRVTAATDFATGWTGVSLGTHPSGDLADVDMGWASEEPAVRRYVSAEVGNRTPVARAQGSPSVGPAPLVVAFDGRGSSDPDGEPLTYAWDFGDGTAASSAAAPSHTYTAEGSYTATLTVSDPHGARSSTTVAVTVGSNAAPNVTMTSPAEGFTYRNGVEVALTATVNDPEDGPLTGSSVRWQVLLHHGTHLHQVGTPVGSTTRFVPLLDHDADSFYELRMTATDSEGAATTVVRTIRPQTAQLTLASTPSGAAVSYEGLASPAPSAQTVAVGFQPTVSAASSFVRDGVTYRFSAWSDGGAQTHVVTMPAASLNLTASYVADGAERLVFTPSADTYVSETSPTQANGSSSRLRLDGDPLVESFARFDVAGLAGREVTGVTLRLHQLDASKSGGRVRSVSGAWSEATTWNTRPTMGTVLAEVGGPVEPATWYEVALPPSVVSGDGALSLGLDSTYWDGLTWASRSSASPPELIVTVSSGDTPPPPPPPPPAGEELVFTPSADTYVSETSPTQANGSSSRLRLDGDPLVESFARFDVAGLAGREVTGVTLRLHQLDASKSGGRVRSVSGAWSEATTWNTRPTMGAVLAEVTGPVEPGSWYEVALPPSVVTGDGALSLGLDSTYWDGLTWASRSTSTPPELIITVGAGDAPPPPPPPPPPPAGEELVFTPSADTYVSETSPTQANGSSSRLRLDGDPLVESFARFDVAGLAGREVTGVTLRLHQLDASKSGGRVRSVSGAWSEATTWNTRPTMGTVLAEVGGPVEPGSWYEVALPPSVVTGDGALSLGLDSTYWDGLTWASRSTSTPPELIITVGAPA